MAAPHCCRIWILIAIKVGGSRTRPILAPRKSINRFISYRGGCVRSDQPILTRRHNIHRKFNQLRTEVSANLQESL